MKEKKRSSLMSNQYTTFTFGVERPGFAFVEMSITSVYRKESVSESATRAIIEGFAITMFSRRKTESNNHKVKFMKLCQIINISIILTFTFCSKMPCNGKLFYSIVTGCRCRLQPMDCWHGRKTNRLRPPTSERLWRFHDPRPIWAYPACMS